VERVVAMAGCPGAGPDDRGAPHFAGGAWLLDLEGVTEWQWEAAVLPYWSALADFAKAEHPEALICLELHSGTVVNNVETFERLSAVGANIVASVTAVTIAIEHEDPFVPATDGIPGAARILASSATGTAGPGRERVVGGAPSQSEGVARSVAARRAP
jgi:sugar phosphate isomerase/epimerase